MNIFYLDSNPSACAQMHNDKHCVKMIVEYAQLLSTAHRVLDGERFLSTNANGRKVVRWKLPDERDSILYQAAHINHPSAQWVRQCDNNYYWLYHLFGNLIDEYNHRYGRTHKTSELLGPLTFVPDKIPHGQFTEPTPAMPDQYKVKGSSLQSYHNYYKFGKEHIAKWSKRPVPSFLAI